MEKLSFHFAEILHFLPPIRPHCSACINGFAVITALRVKLPHTVSNYISALRSIHHVLDLPFDSFSDFSLCLTLRGLHRSMIYVSQWKRPITIQMLYQFAEILLPGGHINNICLLACILVGFFSFFRSSNLLPKSTSTSDFNPLRQLSRGSFRFYDGGVVLTVFYTKSHQFPNEPLCIPISQIPNSSICPVATLQCHFKTFSKRTSNSPAFLIQDNSCVRSLTVCDLWAAIKDLVTLLCLDPTLYSTHSLRRGGATFAFSSGIPSELIKLQGDWHSQAYEVYLTLPIIDRIQFCSQKIQSLV